MKVNVATAAAGEKTVPAKTHADKIAVEFYFGEKLLMSESAPLNNPTVPPLGWMVSHGEVKCMYRQWQLPCGSSDES